jgi:hypothetical protein
MTGQFEALIYTDCVPGQGLRGSAGLQFQARSAGAGQEAMAVVQRALLYEPPTAWMHERRPAADYPPSFAHIWDGYLATAAGVYLGREANGNREGNQLTHSIVTKDPGTYGLVRPAQLFGASFWTDRPAGSTECPAVAAGWQPGPLDAETIQEFVGDHPDGERRLAGLVTALSTIGEPKAQRVLFVAEHPEPVLRWLVAGTLLLPQPRALAVGFKIFSTNPAYATQPVLAVHPDWYTAAPGSGYLVADLVTDRWDEFPVDPVAAAWARLFCSEDPYDVIDAVELAGASGLDPEAALALATAAVLGTTPEPAQAGAVVSWLADGPADLLSAYGGAIVAVVAADTGAWSLPVLRELDGVTRTDRFQDQAADVRMALLSREIETALRGGDPAADPDERVPPLVGDVWTGEHAARAAGLIVGGLASARGSEFDAVLRIASRFGIRPSPQEYAAAAQTFVADWAAHPERSYDNTKWPDAEQWTDRLRDHLELRIRAQPSARVQIGKQWWKRLLPDVVDPDSRLDRALIAAAVADSSGEERTDRIARLLDQARRSPDPLAVQKLSYALWDLVLPTAEQLRLLRRAAPPGTSIDPLPVERYVSIEHEKGRVTTELLALCRELTDSVLQAPGMEVAGLLANERQVAELCRQLPHRDPDQWEEVSRQVHDISSTVLRLKLDEFVPALRSSHPEVVATALLSARREVARPATEALASEVPKTTPEGAAFAFTTYLYTAKLDGSEQFYAGLVQWLRKASKTDVDDAASQVERLAGKNARQQWNRMAEDKGRLLRKLPRIRLPKRPPRQDGR